MVRKLLTVTVGLAALTTISACGHVNAWKGSPKVVDAHTGAPEPQFDQPRGMTVQPQAPQQQSAAATGQKFPLPNERDLMVLTDRLGSNSVEIYDLNTAAPYGARTTASAGSSVASVTGVPMVASTDSSVEIFPVDGSYAGSIDGTWPNSLYPASSSSSMTPLGGSGTMASGRASPHVGAGHTPSQLFFKHGSARLGSGDRQVLRQVAEQAKFAPVDRVRVEGHASTRTGVSDPVEAKIVNLKQSMNRAFNVSSQLMRDGVPAEKIQTTVWGDTKNSGDEAHNRRVDVITGGQ